MSGARREVHAVWRVVALARRLAALSGLALVAVASTPLRGNEIGPALEQRVKAAFIYQFIPYVEWPAKAFAQADSPIVVAVAGPEQAVAGLQDIIGNRTAQGRPVVVRRWRDSEAQGVHVVFVTRAEAGRLPAIARAAQAAGALVVSETEGALDQGGMINFRLVDGRVRFDVALGAVERAGLRISSRLLAVAQSVRPAGP